jgi:putative DNA primase/helicase
VDWPSGVASAGAQACFSSWLGERGTAGASEDAQAVRQLFAFVARHGSARFDQWFDTPHPGSEQIDPNGDPAPPPERFRTQNRAGWRRWQRTETGEHAWRFYLTAEGMKEALMGLAPRDSVRTLARMGLIVSSQAPSDIKRNNIPGLHTVPGHGKMRLYELRSDILASADGTS